MRGGGKELEEEDDCRQMHTLQPRTSLTQGNTRASNCAENALIRFDLQLQRKRASKISFSVFSTRTDKVSQLRPKSSVAEDEPEAPFMTR